MTNEEFRLMASMRCLRKIIPNQEACPTCSGTFDVYGLHALNCGHKSYRHERALDGLFSVCSIAGRHPIRNAPVQIFGVDSRGIHHLYRPGDIQIDGIDFPKMLVDITVVSPFCTNAPAVFTVGQAAQQAEDKKME